jgi:hypothetical protein
MKTKKTRMLIRDENEWGMELVIWYGTDLYFQITSQSNLWEKKRRQTQTGTNVKSKHELHLRGINKLLWTNWYNGTSQRKFEIRNVIYFDNDKVINPSVFMRVVNYCSPLMSAVITDASYLYASSANSCTALCAFCQQLPSLLMRAMPTGAVRCCSLSRLQGQNHCRRRKACNMHVGSTFRTT